MMDTEILRVALRNRRIEPDMIQKILEEWMGRGLSPSNGFIERDTNLLGLPFCF